MGYANADYWRRELVSEELVPIEERGKVPVQILAAHAKFWGIKFRELSFSIAIHPPGESTDERGAYLLRAYQSNGLFAWCERNFFSVPYEQEELELKTVQPVKIRVSRQDTEIFRAEMGMLEGGELREPSRVTEEHWQGKVYLPPMDSRAPRGNKYFVARLQGLTRVYPFQSGLDAIGIDPSRICPPLRMLVESGFEPTEWWIRDQASHAKSKTYSR